MHFFNYYSPITFIVVELKYKQNGKNKILGGLVMSTIVGNMGIGGPATILWPGHTLWLGPTNYSGHPNLLQSTLRITLQ